MVVAFSRYGNSLKVFLHVLYSLLRARMRPMRRYDTNCPACGVLETLATVEDAGLGMLRCPGCGDFAAQHFGPSNAVQMRVDSAGEDSKDPRRIADGSASWNAGLPGVETVIGQRRDGKPKLAYRPLSNSEVSSNRKRREIAARHGLTPTEKAAYRPIGGR